MLRSVILLLAGALVVALGAGTAAACTEFVTASSSGDLIQVMNGVAFGGLVATFKVFDSSGVQQGGSFTTPSFPAHGRFSRKVGDLYTALGVPTTAIKTTWIQVVISTGLSMQVKTGGGPFHVTCP